MISMGASRGPMVTMIWFFLLEHILGCAGSHSPRMEVVVSWPRVSQFPTTTEHNVEHDNGSSTPINMVVWSILPYENRLFLFCPSQFNETSTVNFVYLNELSSVPPKLRPYPPTFNNDVVSVFRAATSCDDEHMYFVDDGVVGFYTTRNRKHLPRVFKVHLPTDSLHLLYTLNSDDYTDTSTFTNLVVDRCNGEFTIYMCDLTAYAVVVVDLIRNVSYRIKHPYFVMDLFSAFLSTPSGYSHTFLNDGVAALALSQCSSHTSDRTLYFASSGGHHMFAVSTSTLRNRTMSSNTAMYRVLGYKGGRSQSNNMVYNADTDVLLYGTTQGDSLICWNTNDELNPQTQRVVMTDHTWYRTPNDLQEDCQGGLWALANNWIEALNRGATRAATEGADIVVLRGNSRNLAGVCTTPCPGD